MPLKLNVSVSKKIGQPDFGSLGATCSVEVELPHNLVFDDLETFHRHARNVYVAATQAVNDELNRHQKADPAANGSANGHTAARSTRNNGNGTNGQRQSNGRKATVSQVRAIHAIASRQGLDLALTLQERHGIDHPEDLSITEASSLIDELKPAANGHGGRR